jgi:hypothetical protein
MSGDLRGLEAVKQFWVSSYTSDRVAFWFELIGFVLTVASSMILALNASFPNMTVIYPLSFVGVSAQAYAAYRRGAAWVLLLTVYFACISLFGFGRAVGWY